MATYTESSISLGTAEIHSFVVDYSADLLTGVTIESGTALHIPPSGTAADVTADFGTGETSGTVTIGPLSVIGVHYLDVIATLSDAETSAFRIAFAVNYPEVTAREGMLDLIYELRGYTDANINEYTIAGVPYWSDKQLQLKLDKHKTELRRFELYPTETYVGGTIQYLDYYIGHGNLESGTLFEVEDASGTTVATANYTVDYQNGKVTFTENTAGTTYYINANSYDVYAAAADVWRTKAAHSAKMYDFSTDGHNLRRSQYMTQCLEMAKVYEGMAPKNSIGMDRSDYAVNSG